MFTGLVQSLGSLRSLGQYELQVLWDETGRSLLLPGLEVGDSIAVDGTCLTVESFDRQGFTAAMSPETLRRTALGSRLEQGVSVNLESSLRVGSKIGGHFVTCHVDGVGQFMGGEATATSWELWFKAPESVARYIVPKGSIAVNGISLTVAEVQDLSQGDGLWDATFMVAVIPHTYDYTNLAALQSGAPVNLEGDVLGKYVEKLVRGGRSPMTTEGASEPMSGNGHGESSEWLTPDFLAEHGYG